MTLYATTERDAVILNIGLAFLATGMMMLVAGLYHRILLRREK